MFINYRKAAKLKMITFGVLFVAGVILSAIAGYMMTVLPHQEIGFWAMMGVASVGLFTIVWTILGFLFALVDYRELS